MAIGCLLCSFNIIAIKKKAYTELVVQRCSSFPFNSLHIIECKIHAYFKKMYSFVSETTHIIEITDDVIVSDEMIQFLIGMVAQWKWKIWKND